ncbi:putative inner membrane protein [Roseimaritima multifibrata]|uniref:Putative inner membrane protein n=1 Tax=Roseimaritima multifibrata TaxID=1930274 RepID=A0A517MLJ1_9BACT|nr:DUF6691 family protein [Roseimaritima multifibrata]QDS95754.1 putative inner membrane protein [Roseimaritima multifibrata]
MSTTIEEPIQKNEKSTTSESDAPTAPVKQLILGLLFGVLFGFLLQKGGVAKFHVLIGQLLLEDFTVVKVMLSAVIVGMLGIQVLHRMGLVELHIKPTRFASNILGGLLFGVGFALSAYCPGTGAAALGQGNYDALAMIAGMIVGSYLFAEASNWIATHIDPIGDRGKLTVDQFLPASRTVIVVVASILLVLILLAIEQMDKT